MLGGLLWASLGGAFLVTGMGSAVAVDAADPPPSLAFDRHAIAQGEFEQTTRSSGVGDIDGDGRPDVVVAGDSYLLWFENPSWAPRLIAPGSFGKGSVVAVHDLDEDGRLDVVTGESSSKQMVWFANRPKGWKPHLLSSGAYCHHLDFADLDDDGREDAACTDTFRKQVVWLEAPAHSAAPWTIHPVDPSRTVWGADIADIDRDGRPDLVAGRAWYRNTPTSPWPRYPYTELENRARPNEVWFGSYYNDLEELTVLDLNEDGRLDVFASLFAGSPEGRVFAFLAPEDPLSGTWTPVQVDAGPLFSVHSLAVADFDGSGRVQVMVAEMPVGGYSFGFNPDTEVIVYRLLGPASDPASWQRTVIDDVGMHEGVAVDVDGDGRPDLMGGEENSDRRDPPQSGLVHWWKNVTAASKD